ncbi:NRDE-2, necessary for RNA interference domain-containing protein [Sarocladium implicatum]|nr:NRDE-2, necessary for RNA interference domain-containing protein [Sarocladium implicatum]
MSGAPEDDASKLTVPKFSSFKGSSKPPTQASSLGHQEDRKDRHRHRKEPRDSRRDGKPRSEGSRDGRPGRHDQSRRDARTPERHGSGHKRNRSEATDAAPEAKRSHPGLSEDAPGVAGLYMIDVKGDPLLRKYGNNVHYHVPSSHRYPPGRVLGASGRLYVHRDGAREQFSILQPGEKPDFREGLRKWPRAHPNPITLRPQRSIAEEAALDLSFIPIGKPKKHRRSNSSDSETSSGEKGLSYRSIEGKMKVRQVHDEPESENDSDENMDIHQDNPLRWRSVQLNRQVKEHPDDIDAWLELVEHQDALLKAGYDIDQSLLENEARSYAEIKLAMLESALANVQSDQDRRRVWILLMRVGTKVWDRKTVARKWSEIPEGERQHFDLWKTYLDFRMSDVTSFQYEEVKTILLARLTYLVGEVEDIGRISNVEEAIYVFLRLTRLVADAGYRELAVSAWQALFELNLFRPANINGAIASLESFQDFWESEVPRFGEAGARGWEHYVASSGAGDPLEAQRPAPQNESTSRDPYKQWAALEQQKGQDARVPARTLDEGNDDDPFRVVMFSDVKPLIFNIGTGVLPDVLGQLVDAFLIFCGLPATKISGTWAALALNDPVVVRNMGRPAPETPEDHSIHSEVISKRPPNAARGSVHASVTLDILFPDKSWFQHLSFANEHTSILVDMVQTALQQALQARKISHLGVYFLALTNVLDPASTKKQAKALLKQYPTDIDLYVAYALAENRSGRNEVADKTFASAFELSSGRDQLNVLRTWSWVELQRGNKESALRVLCSISEPGLRMSTSTPDLPSSRHILKATQIFESETDAFLYSEQWQSVAVAGQCSMLLSYLTSNDSKEPTSPTQGSLAASASIIKRLSQEFRRRNAEHSEGHEQLLQAAARLLYWHASNGPFRRAYMRQQLTSFVAAFPQNTIFLSLFEWFDSGLRVVDETRQLLYDKSLAPNEDSLSGRIFAIFHEIECGNANSTRAAFEQAVNSDSCRSSVLIWVWYIQFCYSQKSLRPKAKDVFYRALRHCPWSKEIMMQAFTTLVRTMESDELRAVYDTMLSKGMRIHVELEDYLQAQERKRAQRHDRK